MIRELIKRFGVWSYLAGTTAILFSVPFLPSPQGWIILVAGGGFALADALFHLLDSRRSQGPDGREQFVTHLTVYLGGLFGIAFYFLYRLIPVSAEETQLEKNIRLALLILFLVSLFGSFLFRFALFIGRNSLSAAGHSLRRARSRHLRDTVFSILAALFLFAAINTLVHDTNPSLDLTPGFFSYSGEARRVIASVDRKVVIYAFLPVEQATRNARKREGGELFRITDDVRILLEQLPSINPNLRIEFHNVDLEPSVNVEFGAVDNGTVIFRSFPTDASRGIDEKPYAERRLYIRDDRDLETFERESVRAVLQVCSPPKTLYLTASNGERSSFIVSDTEARGIATLRNNLKFFNYEIKLLDHTTGWPGTIPDDAAAVLISGAMTPFSGAAKQALLRYIDSGGKLFVTLDPSTTENFAWLLRDTLGSEFEFSPAFLTTVKAFPGVLMTAETTGTKTEIPSSGRGVIVFPRTGIFQKTARRTETRSPFAEQPLLFAAPPSFFDDDKNGVRDDRERQAGDPVALAYRNPNGARLLFFAGTDWISEAGLRFPVKNNNLNFAANSLFWLTENKLTAAIIPPPRGTRNVQITEELKFKNMILGIVLFPSLTVLIFVFATYRYRRRRGMFHSS